MLERRKFPRISVNRGIMWRKSDSLDNLDILSNVSEGGVGLVTNQSIKNGEVVQVEFTLPASKTIQSKAQVRWTSSGGSNADTCSVGLQFMDISSARQQEIRCFVGKCRYGC
nr:Response regulator receiver protein, PilZ domain [uncultured bacterium]